jgi:predicted secreted protein
MRLLLAVLAFFSVLPQIAKAQDYNTLLDIPEGATLVNLSATETLEVQQDLLVANLRFESKNQDPKKLQDDINEIMKKAVDKAKSVPDVKIATQQYYVYPQDFDPNPQPVQKGEAPRKLERTWYGQQGIELKSKKADDLLKLTGELQELGLTMTGLNYIISPELLESTQESMLEAALAKLKAKAERIASALGKSKSDLLQVNVDMGGYYPVPMMARGMAMDAGMEMAKVNAPVAEPGQSQISLTVSAQAMLKK